ncbi:hypothetical protein BLNAU_15894 [Blattamonas nauphoetae]|uniref:Uncharacterized protein n=1 Tax=Blattamonas nauphoetae TaxID=2049346 RepID=A0ABQ9X9P5_9EUKA|nr:hypothetical protein BLNAU_15894 [Blattamonas nauphoetae]
MFCVPIPSILLHHTPSFLTTLLLPQHLPQIPTNRVPLLRATSLEHRQLPFLQRPSPAVLVCGGMAGVVNVDLNRAPSTCEGPLSFGSDSSHLLFRPTCDFFVVSLVLTIVSLNSTTLMDSLGRIANIIYPPLFLHPVLQAEETQSISPSPFHLLAL